MCTSWSWACIASGITRLPLGPCMMLEWSRPDGQTSCHHDCLQDRAGYDPWSGNYVCRAALQMRQVDTHQDSAADCLFCNTCLQSGNASPGRWLGMCGHASHGTEQVHYLGA